MKKFLWAAFGIAVCGVAVAKLPPLDDAAKAKAAETAAKAAWQGKVDGYLLCKSQDKVAAAYRKTSGNAAPALKDGKGNAVKASPTASAAAAATPAASGTPVAAAAVIPPCLEPGPFAYTPPEQKPIETAGAHSPTATAASPPSVKQDAAAMTPAKPSTAAPAAPAAAPTPVKK